MRIFAIYFSHSSFDYHDSNLAKNCLYSGIPQPQIGHVEHTPFGKFPAGEEISLIHMLFDGYG
jgi:hypothetical protein